MQDMLKNYMESVKDFSGVVFVAKQGEILFQGAYGYADEAEKQANTINTKFYVGSINKSITGLCIMKLIEEGKMKLTDTIDSFFPHIYPGQKITIHHLLNHTSGINNHLAQKEFQTGKDFTISEVIEKITTQPLRFSPGEKFFYSNTGYALLGRVIEKISGKPLYDYTREHILQPSAMNDSFFAGDSVTNLAKPYMPVFECKPELTYGAGALISTVYDLYKYDQALYSETLISQEMIRKTMEPSYHGKFMQYGYGWFIKNLYGHRSVSHGGFYPPGHSSHFERYIDDKTTVIVLSNKLIKYSGLGIRFFNSTDVARELAARIYGCKARFWQKLY